MSHTHALEDHSPGFLEKLNGPWHERGLQAFMVVVLAHWGEHLVQAYQIYVLGWARPDSRGILGQFFPWLVASEALHYGYAFVMLVGLWVFRKGFGGTSSRWWMASFIIQFWHHIEHALLQLQVIFHHNLFGKPVPVSILQLWVPRVELHLFYNTVVFIPMVIGMYFHMYPPRQDAHLPITCTCVRRQYASA